ALYRTKFCHDAIVFAIDITPHGVLSMEKSKKPSSSEFRNCQKRMRSIS
ncbi:hypothetical protein CMV_012207, partial [Castanea mollissima]